MPLDDMRELDGRAYADPPMADGSALGTGSEGGTRSIWPSIYPEILRLVEAHRSTIPCTRVDGTDALAVYEAATQRPER